MLKDPEIFLNASPALFGMEDVQLIIFMVDQ